MLSDVRAALKKCNFNEEEDKNTYQSVLKDHFTPKYDPWDQRVCASPDADFFKAMTEKGYDDDKKPFRRSVVVSGLIDKFTSHGTIVMQRGATCSSPLSFRNKKSNGDPKDGVLEIDCDIVILATGFNLQENLPMSYVKVLIDGKEYNAPEHVVYKVGSQRKESLLLLIRYIYHMIIVTKRQTH